MNFHIITLFPEAFDSYLNASILKRAIEDKKIKVKFYDPKNFAEPKLVKDSSMKTVVSPASSKSYGVARPAFAKSYGVARVDDKPYGGGPGMVIRPVPVIKAIAKAIGKKKKYKIIYLSPSANKYTNDSAKSFAKQTKDIIIVCGRYEGIDARVKEVFKGEEFSVGDFVLTGGEIPAMIIIDTTSRQVKGVLGDFDSVEENRTASPDCYTRPEKFKFKNKTYSVPEVLLSGNHAEIEKWRKNINHN